MMKRFLLLSVMAILAVACEFRPLEDPGNVSYIRIYISDAFLNVTTGFYNKEFEHPTYAEPDIMRVGLFDPDTGNLVAERYLRNKGTDEHGKYFDGHIIVNPGVYNLIAYNFGTESTIIGGEYNCYEINAFTNEIAHSLKSKLKSRSKADPETKAEESIRYDADPLLAVNIEGLNVKPHTGIDTLRNPTTGKPWFDANSLAKFYYLQVGINNAQYIASSACLLSGMARSTHILEPDFEKSEETTLYFEMHPGSYPDGYKPGVTDYHCIYTTFGTFGRLPGADNKLSASFEFVTTYGKQVDTTFNIALEFLKEDAIDRQWLLLDCEINIPPPEPGPNPGGGGFTPSVGDWGDVNTDINL